MKIAAYFVVFLLLFSCNSVQPSTDLIPYTFVNLNLNLLDPQYNIPNDGGYKYLSNAGYRGIILYRENSKSYFAFERACPYKPSNTCEIIEMDASNLFFKCKCCASQYNYRGSVTNGVSTQGLLRYSAVLQNNTLLINN